MDEAKKQKCLERLRILYPEPWFVWWGIGAGVHCEEAMGFVRPHGSVAGHINITESLPLAELLQQLESIAEVDADASLRQSGNYVADDAERPRAVWFNNGRVVRITSDATGQPYLTVGTDYQTKDEVWF